MKKLILLMLTLVVAFSFISCDGDTPAPGEDAGTGGNGGPVITIPDADATLENTDPKYTELERLFGEIGNAPINDTTTEYECWVDGKPILRETETGKYVVVNSYGPFSAGQTIVTVKNSNDVATVDGVVPTQEQQNAFDGIMASCTLVQIYKGQLTESGTAYSFNTKMVVDRIGENALTAKAIASFSITESGNTANYTFFFDTIETETEDPSNPDINVESFVVEIDGETYNIASHTDLFNSLYEFIK